MLSPKENGVQSDLCYITKKETTSCFIATLHFRILPAHLWMTAFANSHHPVLRQCNAVIISAVRICGNLLCQFTRMLFLFFCVQPILILNGVLFFARQISDYFSALWFRIIFMMPPLPVGGPQPSAAGRRGLPGCGEKELDVKIHYVFSKEIELVKKQIKYTAILKEYAFYLRNSARLP